ncbi:NADP-dependent oxidoreductase [Halioglobus maricola]|uniref:NADP-dependent oxidoreductase n=1 Tax=Halioglobus maricola TaxID=2601894 RepID=A0A5P9NI90_9GAMM|nr:NADP-dependent oxidoreductase [Halioglobus maricola]QFU75540.1 NADP-dependent oxidoreductase [Halioglobus maricola]
MNEQRNCQWRVAARPEGNVKPTDFQYAEEPIPEIGDGEFLLRTLYLGLRPVMRMYMSGVSAAGEDPLALGDVIHGRGVAQVVASRHPDFSPGEVVHGQLGWQTWKASSGSEQERFIKMDYPDLSAALGVGVLGMNGYSAWGGLMQCGKPQRGDVLVVSAAAGGVGSTVVQMGKALGCTVIGIAGGPEKCALVKSLGADEVIDYKSDDVAHQLTACCPQGIDVYFDNVGGETLVACLDRLAMNARVVLCGSISEYTRDEPFGLTNYTRLRRVNASMNGFFVYNFQPLFPQATAELADLVRSGQLKPVQDVVEGFNAMPDALARLYDGRNVGVQICRVRNEENEWAGASR